MTEGNIEREQKRQPSRACLLSSSRRDLGLLVVWRTVRLQDNESLSPSEAAREARREMEENAGIRKAQEDLVRELKHAELSSEPENFRF